MFEKFISLGWYCGTAAAMSKLGIRSFSGPFDWYQSDFSGVLNCLDNDFDDFLEKKNLVQLDIEGQFKDLKHGFLYIHELKSKLENDYEEIYCKYMRRICLFREQIKERTCFIRCIRDRQELEYIKKNSEYIDSIIKKFNVDNGIIYVISNKISNNEILAPEFFKVESVYSGDNRNELRNLFDSNENLKEFCISNFCENKRMKNLFFDLQKENQKLEKELSYAWSVSDKHLVLFQMMVRWVSLNARGINFADYFETKGYRKIAIYGLSYIGKCLIDELIETNIQVAYGIDKNEKRNYKEIEVFTPDHQLAPVDAIIVTAVTYFDEIAEKLIESISFPVISLEEIINELCSVRK